MMVENGRAGGECPEGMCRSEADTIFLHIKLLIGGINFYTQYAPVVTAIGTDTINDHSHTSVI